MDGVSTELHGSIVGVSSSSNSGFSNFTTSSFARSIGRSVRLEGLDGVVEEQVVEEFERAGLEDRTNGVTAARGRGEAAAKLGSRFRLHSGATFSLKGRGTIGDTTADIKPV